VVNRGSTMIAVARTKAAPAATERTLKARRPGAFLAASHPARFHEARS
jgi:hypothetical protein